VFPWGALPCWVPSTRGGQRQPGVAEPCCGGCLWVGASFPMSLPLWETGRCGLVAGSKGFHIVPDAVKSLGPGTDGARWTGGQADGVSGLPWPSWPAALGREPGCCGAQSPLPPESGRCPPPSWPLIALEAVAHRWPCSALETAPGPTEALGHAGVEGWRMGG
jgi:hypothetical protein